MILHTQWDTTLIVEAGTGVDDFHSLKQIQTVIRPRSYPRLCQFLMRIITVTSFVCTCVKTSAEDDDFQGLSKRERKRKRESFMTLYYWDAMSVQFNNFNFPPEWIKYMLCCVMLFYVVLCCVMLCCVMLCCVMLC